MEMTRTEPKNIREPMNSKDKVLPEKIVKEKA